VSRPAFALALVAIAASLLVGAGCQSIRQAFRPALETRVTNSRAVPFRNTEIDYVDADGFDAIFETSLINRDAVVTVRTPNERPDWTGRLNAWIAAWNMGKSADSRRFRGQIPGFPTIDGDTLREVRLLINTVVDRADDAAKSSVNWFREERIRSRRVELLKPYNLRFHMHTDGKIHLIFFHGDYANQYQQFVAMQADCDEDTKVWSRNNVGLTFCKKMQPTMQPVQFTE
jgi:hypothetical protein